MSSVAGGGKRKEERRHISFDMSTSSASAVQTADMDENLEKRNQRRNKLFRRIQMDIKAKCCSKQYKVYCVQRPHLTSILCFRTASDKERRWETSRR